MNGFFLEDGNGLLRDSSEEIRMSPPGPNSYRHARNKASGSPIPAAAKIKDDIHGGHANQTIAVFDNWKIRNEKMK